MEIGPAKKGTGGRAHIDQSKRAYGVLPVDPSACIFLRTFNAEEIYIQEEMLISGAF